MVASLLQPHTITHTHTHAHNNNHGEFGVVNQSMKPVFELSQGIKAKAWCSFSAKSTALNSEQTSRAIWTVVFLNVTIQNLTAFQKWWSTSVVIHLRQLVSSLNACEGSYAGLNWPAVWEKRVQRQADFEWRSIWGPASLWMKISFSHALLGNTQITIIYS